jgi:hypothetical protein
VKHREHHKSRSFDFAELIDAGFNVLQNLVELLLFAGSEVILLIKNPKMVSIDGTNRKWREILRCSSCQQEWNAEKRKYF